jgi:predicted ABC-type ATPase
MKKAVTSPILLIIGGPNGAGKTTFAREYLTREMKGLRFLNTDEIARGLSPFDVDSVAFKAGRIFLEEVKGEIAEGNSLAIESTLSGKAHAKIIRDAKASGYLIRIHFLWIPSAKFSRKRVTQRTKQGGHDVPTDAIMRRFPRIFTNLVDLYLPLADEWSLWDSSERPAKLLADHSEYAIPSLREFFLQDDSLS